MSNNIVPLARIKRGTQVVVADLMGGRGFVSRLTSMGILPGTVLEILQSQSKGQIVIGFSGGRIAMGRGMAEKVMVRPVG